MEAFLQYRTFGPKSFEIINFEYSFKDCRCTFYVYSRWNDRVRRDRINKEMEIKIEDEEIAKEKAKEEKEVN